MALAKSNDCGKRICSIIEAFLFAENGLLNHYSVM